MGKTLRIFLLMFALFVEAQTGTNIYNFMNIAVSPRQAALGGDAISVRDADPNFSAVNPSLMNLEMDQRVSANYSSYLAGSNIGTINYVKDLQYGHLLSLNVRYLDYGSIPRTDEAGNTTGSFSASDAAIGAGYAYQFEDNWTIGANVNFITSKIDNFTSAALLANLGVTYYNEQQKESVALVFHNFGRELKTYDGQKEKLPFRIDLGYTKILPNFPVALTVTAHDLQKFNISQPLNSNGQKTSNIKKLADHLSFGAELFPENGFNLRLGYNVKRGSDLAVQDQRSFSGLSAGFGFKISWLRFDYTHVRYSNASNMNFIGLSLDLYGLNGIRR